MNRVMMIFLSAVCLFVFPITVDAQSEKSVSDQIINEVIEVVDGIISDGKDLSVAEGVKAVAALNGTVPGSLISGTVTLTETLEGLKVDVEVAGVSPGKHGFHIHEVGSCEDGGNAAGGHYNPKSVPHGFLPKDGVDHAHCGDMGNIAVSPDGIGGLSVVLPGVTLSSEDGVAGRSLILHEKEDDFGQPTGNAGGRIACGIIVMAE